jgi:hypothetical protein
MICWNVAKLRLTLIVLLTLGISSGWISLGAAAALAPAPVNNRISFFLSGNSSIISDFDGDNRPDLVTGRSEGNTYKVEIQFSARKEKTYFTLDSGAPGLSLFACDIDRDNDKDLVITSMLSSHPLAVWLSDGQGNFKRDNDLYTGNIYNDDPVGCERNAAPFDQAALNQSAQLPFDRATLKLFSINNIGCDIVANNSTIEYLKLLAYKITSRGPPTFVA